MELFGFDGSGKNVDWLFPKSSSTMYCRPVRFSFKKETVEVMKEENYSLLRHIYSTVSVAYPYHFMTDYDKVINANLESYKKIDMKIREKVL